MKSLNQACSICTMRTDGRTDRQTTTIVPMGRNVVVESRHSVDFAVGWVSSFLWNSAGHIITLESTVGNDDDDQWLPVVCESDNSKTEIWTIFLMNISKKIRRFMPWIRVRYVEKGYGLGFEKRRYSKRYSIESNITNDGGDLWWPLVTLTFDTEVIGGVAYEKNVSDWLLSPYCQYTLYYSRGN